MRRAVITIWGGAPSLHKSFEEVSWGWISSIAPCVERIREIIFIAVVKILILSGCWSVQQDYFKMSRSMYCQCPVLWTVSLNVSDSQLLL